MLEYIDFVSQGAAYVPHLYIRRENIISVSGLEPPECIHTYSEIPSVNGAVYGSSRFEQRRVSIEFRLPTNYYLSSNSASSNGNFATMSTNLYNLRKLDFSGASKLDIKTVDEYGEEYHYYLHNTRIEKVSYPTIGAQQNIIIDFVSDESYFCGEEMTGHIWNASPDPAILTPGKVRGDGITATIYFTSTEATTVKLRIWKLMEGRYEEMQISVGSGSNRSLYIDTRFGQKSIKLNGANYINHLSYDSEWLKPDSDFAYVYAVAANNPYVNYTTSRYSYEPAYMGMPL